MAQVQRIRFSKVDEALAQRYRDRGTYLVATPGDRDVFERHDGVQIAWRDLQAPKLPLMWWQQHPENTPIAQAHVWLESKGWIRSGSCTVVRLYAVTAFATRLPAEYLGEILADEPDFEMRNILVHLHTIRA